MNGFILIDDQRLIYTEKELLKCKVNLFDTLNQPEKLDFIILGMNGINEKYICQNDRYYKVLDDKFFKKLKKDVIIYVGKNNELLNDLQKIYKFKLVTLLKDRDIIKQNAKLTAEGLISEIIQKRPYLIENSNVVLIGFGNCGKEIYEKLKVLKANIKIVEKDISKLDKQIENISVEDIEKEKIDILINTVDSIVINDAVLEKFNKEIYLFDIASYPYGYHHENAYKLNDYILPALPSKYAYKEAGIILANKIMGDLNV